jgi:hypothetical protein
MKITIRLLLTLTILTLATLATGCGKGVPKPASPEVQGLVSQIVEDFYRDQLSPYIYKQATGIPIDVLGIEVDYAWLTKEAKTDESAKKVLGLVDEAMRKTAFIVENIRTDKVEKEVGKIYCNADLRVGDQSSTISFTAQYTDGGDLYVEVFGLDE